MKENLFKASIVFMWCLIIWALFTSCMTVKEHHRQMDIASMQANKQCQEQIRDYKERLKRFNQLDEMGKLRERRPTLRQGEN